MANSYRIKVREAQVLRAIAETNDAAGNPLGYEHVSDLYLYNEEVPEDKVSPVIKEAYEAGDPHTLAVFEKVGGDGSLNVAARLGVPFDDYDSLSEEQVVDALRVLPGATVQAVKQYEALNQNRDAIVTYNAGLREAERDRLEGRLSSPLQEATPKPTADIPTREVTEDDVVETAPISQADPEEAAAPTRGRGRKGPQPDVEGTENDKE